MHIAPINPTRTIQGLLAGMGFDPGALDGDYGAKTERAFRAAIAHRTPLKKHSDDNALPWISAARKLIGQREIKGAKHNPYILDMWKAIGKDFGDDETPWCAGFVGACLEYCNIASTKSSAARSYASWGTELKGPVLGCVVAYWRGSPSGWLGHVGFVVGRDANGNLMTLGGNQGDAVNVKPFDVKRVLSYRWPKGSVLPQSVGFADLPLMDSDGRASVVEA